MTPRINLCFHGIGTPARELEPGEDPYWITPDLFGEILDYASTRPGVELSFDDGNASDVEVALPALRTRGLVASFFPLAARIGQPGSVDASGVRMLRADGMIIGSHGMHHQRWRGLGADALDEELVSARSVIAEAAGVSVTTAACPLGSYDRRVISRLRTLKYTRVFTSDRAVAKSSAWLQPRFSIRRDDTIDDVRALVEVPVGSISQFKSSLRMTAKRWR
jgi:peptidoglycan/xylan/chitin deacetylase (PgdA/CDA1 family)